MADKKGDKWASGMQKANFNAAASGRPAQPPKMMTPKPAGINGPKPPGSVQKAVDKQVFAQQAAKVRASQAAQGVNAQPKPRTSTSATFNKAATPQPLSLPSGRGRR